MREYILDTNVILRMLLLDHPQQAKSIESLLEQAQRGSVSLSIPSEIVVEVEHVLRKVYQVPPEKIAHHLLQLCQNPLFLVEKRGVVMMAFEEYTKNSLGYVDNLLRTQARSEGKKLFTFDVALWKAGV